jgi:hypothetical protein
MRADFWWDLVESDGKPGDPTFACVVIADPRYRKPLLLVFRLPERPGPAAEGGSAPAAEEAPRPPVSGPGLRHLYRDRWAVEMLPLAAPTAHLPKGVLGHRRHLREETHEQTLRLAA